MWGQRRACRDTAAVVLVDNEPVSLLSLRSDGIQLLLRYELEVVADDLSLGDFCFCAVVVPSVRMTVHVCDLIPATIVGPSGGAHVAASPTADLLLCPFMVAERTSAAY